MTNGPIELGNWVMILLGACMFAGGPWLLYRTVMAELEARRDAVKGSLRGFNAIVNIVIGVAILAAGALFIVNNLRGNPLA